MSPNKEQVTPTVYEVLEKQQKENDLKNSRLAETEDFLSADESYRSSKAEFVPRIRWPDLVAQIFIHAGCVYGIYLIFAKAKLLTTLWGRYDEDYAIIQ